MLNKHFDINEEIKVWQVRVIDSDGSQLGILNVSKALNLAREKNLDLVKIADQANLPVCKIMDYGKYCFEISKKGKEMKKKQSKSGIKEVRLSVNISQHDLETKAAHAKEFLNNGDKVKVTLRFKGRETWHPEIASKVMREFAELCGNSAVIEKNPMHEGRNMIMFLIAKPNKALTDNKNLSSKGLETTTEISENVKENFQNQKSEKQEI